jgi:hypothetical protein
MQDGDKRRAPCPECGAQATFEYSEYAGKEYCWCVPCDRRKQREQAACKAAIRNRFPELSDRIVNTLVRGGWDGGLPVLLAASDAELLDIRNFGKGMLAEFRVVWPTPSDPVVMVARPPAEYFWKERHDVLSLIGG